MPQHVPKPNNVIISNLTSTGADFSWTPGGTEPSWNIEYGAAGFTLGTGTASTVTNTSYSASGLSSQTDYDFYVQADCGSGDLSNWEGPISFSTPLRVEITSVPIAMALVHLLFSPL